MRILFFSHYFAPEGNAPASRTYEHCVRWVRAGHRVTVITCVPNVPDGVVYTGYHNRLWPQRENLDGINVVRVWTFLSPNAGNARRIANYISYMLSSLVAFVFFCRRPQVVIATSPQFFCGWAGVLASWLKWCPFVLEIRDIWPESIVTVGAMRKGLAVRFLELLERWMYRSARQIVTVGHGYRDNIQGKIGDAKPVTVITNGVDANLFSPREKSTELLTNWDLKNRFICAYVGTIGMAHHLEVTIRAARRLLDKGRQDIVFLLVGDGARRHELEEMVQAAGVGELVRFTGRMAKEKIPDVIATCDAQLIHLRKSELFETVIPSKIFEAMAMERPLIMGVRGESAEIVARANAGIPIEPENDAELVDAVERLADDRNLYRQLCANARQFVLSEYSRDELAERFLTLLLKITGQK
jgi:glycosyltransferase involved in cell wall biosynthesis